MALGIDYGYTQVKAIDLEKTGGEIKILKTGTEPLKLDSSQFDPENVSNSHWIAAIQELMASMKLNPKRIKSTVSGISGNHVNIKQLTTLEMADEELTISLEFEAKKHIPLDGTEAVMDYHILGQNAKELDKIDVLLFATTKNLINQHNGILKDCGFKTGIFDTDPVALVNMYLFNRDLPEDGADVILNIGSQNTTLVVWGQNNPFFTREIHTSGYQFTKAIMDTHNIGYPEAEQMKFELGTSAIKSEEKAPESGSDSPFSIQVAEKTIFTNLTEEIRKSLRYYMKSNPQAFFNNFYLCGGSAPLAGLSEFIAEQLKVKVSLLNPLGKFPECSDIENPYKYGISFGLALRGVENN